jgi:hypothetical protein
LIVIVFIAVVVVGVEYYIILIKIVVVLRHPRISQSAAEGDRFLKKVYVLST